MSLSSNKLTESIPSQFSKFDNLKFLSIHSNKLSGEIPLELSNLKKLGKHIY